ncbi:MAG TPA: hypothetical protein VMU09_02685 [Acidimicrobiales bacterium]|nr:hypothetical protein [Acidimicrobiales bacterium]
MTRRTAGLRARAFRGAGTALVAVLGTGIVAPGTASAGTPVPGAGGCPAFPADDVWNADISALPVDPHSAAWTASMSAASTHLHPDFGPSGDPSNPYGMPFTVVPAGHPVVSVAFDYADESDPGPYPFGADTPIEGGASSTGDRHALMLDPATCTLYELYDATYAPGGSTAGSGAIWNLRSNALRPATWTSADAAGLPILPGLLRYDEVLAGSVTHAIRMTAVSTDKSFVWPARHQAGTRSDPSLPPMGARFRLRADFDVSGYSAQAQVVLRAMRHYGLILADNGSNWYFGGTADPAWPAALVAELKQVPASAFDAVDESSLMVSPDSGQVRTGANGGSGAGAGGAPARPAAPAGTVPAPPAQAVAAPTSTSDPGVPNPGSSSTTTGTRSPPPGSRLAIARASAGSPAPRRLGSGWLAGTLGVLGALALATGSTWVAGMSRRRRVSSATAEPGDHGAGAR